VGKASPTTLRYLKVARDITKNFGVLTGMNIVEIGIGYGGQCRVLSSLYRPGTYALVDLPPVLKLAERFLSESLVDSPTRFISAFGVPEMESDLVVSNYAFSELRREVQEMYMSRVVEKSRRGYMTFNRITPSSFGSMTAEEFAMRVGGSVIPERPLSYPGNRIIVWER
jgi:putative sugar O-methyltransferase